MFGLFDTCVSPSTCLESPLSSIPSSSLSFFDPNIEQIDSSHGISDLVDFDEYKDEPPLKRRRKIDNLISVSPSVIRYSEKEPITLMIEGASLSSSLMCGTPLSELHVTIGGITLSEYQVVRGMNGTFHLSVRIPFSLIRHPKSDIRFERCVSSVCIEIAGKILSSDVTICFSDVH